MNDGLVSYLNTVKVALGESDDPTLQADEFLKLPTLKTVDNNTNAQTLVDYIEEFKFDWINFDVEEGSIEFATEAIQKIKQIVSDIDSTNQYHLVFTAELAYSRLKDSEYEYKMVSQSMNAKTVEEATRESEDIRRNASKIHPEDEEYTLEDARIKVDIIDQNGITVIKNKSVDVLD